MNIHEHQAKEILKKFGVNIPNGVPIFSLDELEKKYKLIKSNKVVLKAQIHAGGRGKAGGIKLLSGLDNLKKEAKLLFGKKLITHQTGPNGKIVKRLYLEEATDIQTEFYLSCLVDRSSSKIAFISSAAGGMDIEKVAKKNIIKPFKLSKEFVPDASELIKKIYKILIELDANLIEINPLIFTKDKNLVCLDAKINFDDNALFRHPEILSLKDLNEEDPIETKANKHGLSYIKLDGEIGCMVNGAGLAMATMDIIKLYGSNPANFLDVGGGASKEKVSEAFKIILSDKNVKGILVNIFGGIMRCDILAQGIVDAVKEIKLSIPLVVRLAGTNVELGKKILDKSGLKIISANNLSDAAKKVVSVIK